MGGTIHEATPEEVRAGALALLATLTDRQLEARWNLGPTTGAVLRAVAANSERVRYVAGHVSPDDPHPATSTVYVRPSRPFRIAAGPSQFYGPWPGDDDYDDEEKFVHPDWCECDELRRYLRDELGLDQEGGPDEILGDAPWELNAQAAGDDEPTPWLRLWWD